MVDIGIESPVVTDNYGNFECVDETKTRRVSNVTVNGESVDLDKKYTIANSKYVLMEGGDGLTMLDDATVVQDDLPCDSEMLIEYFTEILNGVIPASLYGDPKGDDRINIYDSASQEMGDVNGDGDVNSLDAAWVLKYDAEMLSVYRLGIIFADVNSDGNVDSLDAARILKYDAGILESVFENAVVE